MAFIVLHSLALSARYEFIHMESTVARKGSDETNAM